MLGLIEILLHLKLFFTILPQMTDTAITLIFTVHDLILSASPCLS